MEVFEMLNHVNVMGKKLDLDRSSILMIGQGRVNDKTISLTTGG